ncbi:MAG TPA: hypothetical protein VKX28_06160 [Xanthobacteraceae bacterium]|nr:hypothetical protein [Xanthobacteraceae bacterium]
MATILTFSPQGVGARAARHAAASAEIIVFPRTDIRALRRLTDAGDVGIEHPTDLPDEKALD